MKKIILNTMVLLMAASAIVSCKSSETVDPTLTIDTKQVTLTQKDSVLITATLSDYSNDYVVWASDNQEVATVSQKGLVKAITPGTANITAKCEFGKSREVCVVTVNPILATSIKLNKSAVKKMEGETETLTVTITPADATYKTVTWTSSDETVAKVKDGVVTCGESGTATITATTTDGTKLSASCTVDVKSSGNFIKWMADNAGSKSFILETPATPATSTKGCISYDGARISWTENTTGAPRIDSLTLSNGSRIVITQFEEKDVAGSYKFVSKIFKGAEGIWTATNTSDIPVTFKLNSASTGLQDADGDVHINDIEIAGLFNDMVMESAFEFDYDAKTARLGLFLDTRNGQGQAVGAKYGVFFPGLCTKTATAWSSPWAYNEVELGDPDYTWLWFNFNPETCTFLLKNRTHAEDPIQEISQYSNKTMNKMCGFGVILSATNVFDRTTFPTVGTSGYANFFQMNPTGYSGECFVRTDD